MKIAIIADPIDEQYAGIYVYAKELIEALERQNSEHEIVYVHLRENGFFEGKKELIVPLKRGIPGWATFRKFFQLPWLFRRHRFDVVHDLSHIAPFAFWGGGYQRVVTIHDLTPVLFPQWHILASRVVHRIIFPMLGRRADLIVADSECTRKDMLDHYAVSGRIETLPLAARSSVKQVPCAEAKGYLQAEYGIEQPFLLYVGTIEPRKNIDLLIGVFEQLVAEQRIAEQVGLVLVGKQGWYTRQLEDRLATLSPELRARVVFTGYVPETDLKYLYSAAEVKLYPSWYEGFGLPPLEAMVCGCPVIASNRSSLPEVVGEGGICLDPDDQQGWCDAIVKVLSVPAERDKLRQLARQQAQRFDWNQHARQLLNLYESLVDERSAQ